ncbi:MAG: ABC transporter ATP-binding protein [Archaeoglobaceae archaeon]
MKIKVSGVEFSFNGSRILKDMNLMVESGEVLGIVGPNGSGKTTLLRCINRILRPKKGTILIDGQELNSLGQEDIARRVGYVPQTETRTFPATVFDTVLMGRKPHMNWKPGERDLRIVSEVIKKLGLESLAMRDITELSGGQRQKVIMARALAQEPQVLLLDEPTSSLDLKHQMEVMNIAKSQTEYGVSVVMAIHDLNLAARYSDKIIMVKDGYIHYAGGTEILTPRNIESVYEVKVKVKKDSDRIWIMADEPLNSISGA